MKSRLIPSDKIEGLRFGQLLLCALQKSGHLTQCSIPQDINSDTYSGDDVAYRVSGVDLFYLENDELERILQDFLDQHK